MEKSVAYYMGLPYTIELRKDGEDGWFVRVKELPGCMSQGDTAEEALTSIREVMPLWFETALESDYQIPEPRADEEYSGKFVVRVPRSLHRELVQGADADGVSLNQFINVVLSKAVGQTPRAQSAGSQDDPSWPGLKSSMWRVLTAAGLSEDAGRVDESLLASWADQMICQVEAALDDGNERDALSNLASLDTALAAGVSRSPILHVFRHTIKLLHYRITAKRNLQQKITSLAEARNRSFVAKLIREKQMSSDPPAHTRIGERKAQLGSVQQLRQ